MRTKIFFAVLAIVAVVGVFLYSAEPFSPRKDLTGELPPAPKPISDAPLPGKDDTKYFLSLEGDSLCAYREEEGTKKLIISKAMQPMLMSDEDITRLRDGIYAESYEDLCLYFESYLS